jgi:hypothetical protein
MKKKWILIIVLAVIVLINPSKIGSFSNGIGKKSVKLDIIRDIDINNNFDYVEYDKNLIYYNDKVLKNISPSGKELFSVAFDIKNLNLESNIYIDILDKDKNIAYSVDKEGNVVVKKSMNKNGLLYKSMDNDSYLYAYRKDNKDIVNIYDYEFKLVKSIDIKGAVTNIEYSSTGIYIVSINTENRVKSTVSKYDYNGNLKNTKDVNNSIILDIILNEDNIYMIEKNIISKISMDLKVLDEFEVKDIKAYSNLYKDSMYVIENDNKIKYIDKKMENIKTYPDNLKGIINTSNSFIIYDDNKIMNDKGVELKQFNENIKSVSLIKSDILVVRLDNTIQIINIK